MYSSSFKQENSNSAKTLTLNFIIIIIILIQVICEVASEPMDSDSRIARFAYMYAFFYSVDTQWWVCLADERMRGTNREMPVLREILSPFLVLPLAWTSMCWFSAYAEKQWPNLAIAS